MDNNLFKYAPVYREYKILNLIKNNPHITQRELSDKVDIAVSMINKLISQFEDEKYLVRSYITTKSVKYTITLKGIERIKLLDIAYLKSSYDIYVDAKQNIIEFISSLVTKGYHKLLLYGAGEVAKMLIFATVTDELSDFEILAIIDDDKSKIGTKIAKYNIIGLDDIDKYSYDGVLIGSYTNYSEMKSNLIKKGLKEDKIVAFFD